jgi:hypothetical protein
MEMRQEEVCKLIKSPEISQNPSKEYSKGPGGYGKMKERDIVHI